MKFSKKVTKRGSKRTRRCRKGRETTLRKHNRRIVPFLLKCVLMFMGVREGKRRKVGVGRKERRAGGVTKRTQIERPSFHQSPHFTGAAK